MQTAAPQPSPNDLLTEKEAAPHLHLSVNTLRSWRQRNVGPRYLKIGHRSVRYRRSDLDAFITEVEAKADRRTEG